MRRLPGRAVRSHRGADPRAARRRPLRRHALHDGPARAVVPPRDAAPRCPLGGRRGPKLCAARAAEAERPSARAHAALHAPRRVRRASRTARRARCEPRRLGARLEIGRVRRRQPPRRPRGRRPLRHRRLRQEHAGDHAPPRIVGRARRARHRRRARADERRAGGAGLGRVRIVPGVHRRLPDRRDHRRRRARCPPLPELPHPVADGRRCRLPRSWGTVSTGATSARTSARGTRGPIAAPRSSTRMPSTTRSRRSPTGSTPTRTSSRTAIGGCTCPIATAAGWPETRAPRFVISAHGHRADPAKQLLRGPADLGADRLGLDHLGLAAVAQDLRRPATRASRTSRRRRRLRHGPAARRAAPRAPQRARSA